MELPAFSIDINDSRYQRIYRLILLLLLVFALYYLPFSWVVRLSIVLGLLLTAGFYCWQCCRFRHDKTLIRLQYHDQCWWLCMTNSSKKKQPFPVDLIQATVWRWLIVMNFCCLDTGSHYHLTIWPDSIDRDQLRHLRVILRHQSVFGRVEQQ